MEGLILDIKKICKKFLKNSKQEMMMIWNNKLEVRLERMNRLRERLGETKALALIDLFSEGPGRENV